VIPILQNPLLYGRGGALLPRRGGEEGASNREPDEFRVFPGDMNRGGERSSVKRRKEIWKKIPMTKEGFRKLQDELDRLRRVERPQALQAMNEQRDTGTSAITPITGSRKKDAILSKAASRNSTISWPGAGDRHRDLATDKVVFGCTVLLGDLDADRKIKYRIVGADEADIKNGRISVNSPVAKALIGRSAGDVVQIVVPPGRRNTRSWRSAASDSPQRAQSSQRVWNQREKL